MAGGVAGAHGLANRVDAGDRMSRTCSICRHPRRYDIEADLIAGTGYRDIARQRNLSKDALARHRARHMLSANAPNSVVGDILALLDQATTAATWNATLSAVREARNHAKELADKSVG
jgi:hypothetical protein